LPKAQQEIEGELFLCPSAIMWPIIFELSLSSHKVHVSDKSIVQIVKIAVTIVYHQTLACLVRWSLSYRLPENKGL